METYCWKTEFNLPTLKYGTNCVRAITKKNKLKKNLNWLINTNGMNVIT